MTLATDPAAGNPVPFAATREAVARLVEERLAEALDDAAEVVAEWEAVCEGAVRRDWQVLPPSRERLLRLTGRVLAALRAAPALADDAARLSGRPLARAAEAAALLRRMERLAGWQDEEDFRRLSLAWFPLDEAALFQGNKHHRPTQAMLDEDWSDHPSEPGPGRERRAPDARPDRVGPVPDPQGRNVKVRPCVVLADEGLLGERRAVAVVAVAGEVDVVAAEDRVELPWHADRHPRTGLRKHCAADCGWREVVYADDVREAIGHAPEAELRAIMLRVAALTRKST